MKRIYLLVSMALIMPFAATAQNEKKSQSVKENQTECMADSIVADTIIVYSLKTGKVGNTIVKGYKTIENGVVNGYKAIENGFVNGYKKIEEKFVAAFLNEEKKTK